MRPDRRRSRSGASGGARQDYLVAGPQSIEHFNRVRRTSAQEHTGSGGAVPFAVQEEETDFALFLTDDRPTDEDHSAWDEFDRLRID